MLRTSLRTEPRFLLAASLRDYLHHDLRSLAESELLERIGQGDEAIEIACPASRRLSDNAKQTAVRPRPVR
jgi:hypothetical protein